MLQQTTCSSLLAALVLGCLPCTAEQAAAFSHDDWEQVLSRFVDEEGLVDYRGLAADRAAFDRYLDAVRSTGPANRPELFPSRSHELAYYINAYNAHVFAGVLDEGPEVDSVWGWSGTGYGFFVRRKIVVGGRTTNLKQLEDEVIREGFQDPRSHAALNCASLGCPRLPREPFLGERLDEQLDAAMTEFVRTGRGSTFDSTSGTVSLSKIFSWFEQDFLAYEKRKGNEEPLLVDYVNRYRPQEQPIPQGATVRFLDYDKGLNDQG